VEGVASLSQGRTAAAQCGLFTHKSVPVIFEPPCNTPHTPKKRIPKEKHLSTNRLKWNINHNTQLL